MGDCHGWLKQPNIILMRIIVHRKLVEISRSLSHKKVGGSKQGLKTNKTMKLRPWKNKKGLQPLQSKTRILRGNTFFNYSSSLVPPALQWHSCFFFFFFYLFFFFVSWSQHKLYVLFASNSIHKYLILSFLSLNLCGHWIDLTLTSLSFLSYACLLKLLIIMYLLNYTIMLMLMLNQTFLGVLIHTFLQVFNASRINILVGWKYLTHFFPQKTWKGYSL